MVIEAFKVTYLAFCKFYLSLSKLNLNHYFISCGIKGKKYCINTGVFLANHYMIYVILSIRLKTHQISVQDPVRVQIMDSIQDLIQQTLHHSLRHHDGLLVGLRRSVELDDVPQIVLRVVKQQPHFAVIMGEEHSDQVDDIRMLQLSE